MICHCRCIDVSTEWCTFQDDPESADRSRVGAIQNSLIEQDLSTVTTAIQSDKGEFKIKNTKSKAAVANSKAYNEMKNFADRLNADMSIISRSQHIFNLANQESKFIKEKSKSVIIATCLFIGI